MSPQSGDILATRDMSPTFPAKMPSSEFVLDNVLSVRKNGFLIEDDDGITKNKVPAKIFGHFFSNCNWTADHCEFLRRLEEDRASLFPDEERKPPLMMQLCSPAEQPMALPSIKSDMLTLLWWFYCKLKDTSMIQQWLVTRIHINITDYVL